MSVPQNKEIQTYRFTKLYKRGTKKSIFQEIYTLYIHREIKREIKKMITLSSKQNKKVAVKSAKKAFSYLETTDKRMRFNNSRDPLYHVFDQLEDRSLDVLVKEFVKDSFYEMTRFVSKMAK